MTKLQDSPSPTDDVLPFPKPLVSWYATIVLAFLYWMSVLDRFIIALLVDPIKADLGLTDIQFGLLQGFAFIFSFTIFGFIFGALADRKDRRKLIYIGVTVWSMATAFCGLAQNFLQMLVARVGLGAGESSLNPCATSMISDLFPRHRLTSALAVYSIGATIGSGTALIVGGAIIHAVSQMGDIVLPIIGHIKTWQAVFLIVGIPGLVFSFVVFTFPEPLRRGRSSAVSESDSWRSTYRNLFAFIKLHPRFFSCHYIGFLSATAVVNGCVAWYPVHMMRTYGWGEGQIGLMLGSILMVGGILGKIVCGWSVDTMYRKGYRDAQFRWYATCLILGAPLGIIATTSGNPWLFLVMIGFFVMLVTSMHACALSSLNLVTPNQLRGSGVAVFSTIAGLIGGSAGAVLVPVAAEVLFDGEASIGLGMATLIAVACPLGALSLFLGMRSMRAAMEEQELGIADPAQSH